MTNAPNSTNPNATRGDSWCRRYTVGPHLIPVPADAPLPVAEPLPEWLKRSKPLTHALPLPADYGPRTPAEGARKPRRPTLASVAKQANKAAIAVARYEIKPDGTIVLVTGQGESTEPENPWLAELPKETKQ